MTERKSELFERDKLDEIQRIFYDIDDRCGYEVAKDGSLIIKFTFPVSFSEKEMKKLFKFCKKRKYILQIVGIKMSSKDDWKNGNLHHLALSDLL